MKRNNESNQKKRRKASAQYLMGGGDSRYARKVKSGNQMYGPHCCAHDRPANYMHEAVAALIKWSKANFGPMRKWS